MTIEEKYNKYVEIFYKYFIYDAPEDMPSSNIPLEYVNFDSSYGFAGDGTINISYYLQYLYTLRLLGEENNERIEKTLKSLKRLIDGCYDMFISKCPGIYFKKEDGFFLRDDISSKDASNFNLKSIDSSYSRMIERINEDPCHSPFVSQDQVWNLLPMLSVLKNNVDAAEIGRNITGYIVNNKHKIYNPYYSAIYHNWTYLHIFEPYWERIPERNRKLKYNIKVKRGANNWYFSYGFRKAYKEFGGNCSTFWHSLWYKPFIFLADRIYHPYICKWFKIPVKDTSYYSLAVASGAWYFGNYEKRIIKKFNESLSEEELFQPQLVFLTSDHNDIDYPSLNKWLENYPEPKEEGTMNSPIIYMILYNWYKLRLNL